MSFDLGSIRSGIAPMVVECRPEGFFLPRPRDCFRSLMSTRVTQICVELALLDSRLCVLYEVNYRMPANEVVDDHCPTHTRRTTMIVEIYFA